MRIQDYNPFLGILELLGILFPGAIITLMGLNFFEVQNQDIYDSGKESSTFLFGFVFLILSYFFGQVVFQLGSLVDDFYDAIQKRMFDQSALEKVKAYRSISKEDPKPIINTFEWSLMTLQNKENQKPYNEVVKMKADSKFFRAIFIIALLAVFYSLIFLQYDGRIFFTSLLVMIISFVFYIKIRQKCSKTMYKHILYYFEKSEI